MDFEIYRENVLSLYNEYSVIDVEALNRVLEVISQSNATNFIIYNVANLQPIFTSFLDHSIRGQLNKIIRIFERIEDLCLAQENITEESMTIELNLPNVVVNAIRTNIHWIVSLTDPTQINKNMLTFETNLIKNILSNLSLYDEVSESIPIQ